MLEQILKSVISYVVPAILGFLVAIIRNNKKKNDNMKELLLSLKDADMTLLQCNISNAYFYYEPFKKMPDYIYKNVLNQFKAYKELKGNDYVDSLVEKMKSWEITRTDILKDK